MEAYYANDLRQSKKFSFFVAVVLGLLLVSVFLYNSVRTKTQIVHLINK